MRREAGGEWEGWGMQDAMCLWGMGWVFWRLWEKMGVESHGVGWGEGGRCFFEGAGRRMFWKSVIG